MGKHHLPATIIQPPNPALGMKLIRFWEHGFKHCVSNTLVKDWRWTEGDTRASFDLWPEHPLLNRDYRELCRMLVTTNEDVPVVWHIDRIGTKRDCPRFWIVDGATEIARLLPPDWYLLGYDWNSLPEVFGPPMGPGIQHPPTAR